MRFSTTPYLLASTCSIDPPLELLYRPCTNDELYKSRDADSLPLVQELRTMAAMNVVTPHIKCILTACIRVTRDYSPVFLLIIVNKRSVNKADAKAAAEACKKLLQERGFRDLDVVIASLPQDHDTFSTSQKLWYFWRR